MFVLNYVKTIISSHHSADLCMYVSVCSYSMLRWYHEDSLISADSSSYSILDNGVTLVVEGADTEQSGEYRCEAEGLGSVSGNLSVIGNQLIYVYTL